MYTVIPVLIKMKEKALCLPYCKQLKAILKFIIPEPVPPASKRFTGLSRLIVRSSTGGSPFVIDNVDSLFDPNSNSYNIFSEDLANWGYTNLTADSTLGFTLELEWYE